jgi:hypothetical protein
MLGLFTGALAPRGIEWISRHVAAVLAIYAVGLYPNLRAVRATFYDSMYTGRPGYSSRVVGLKSTLPITILTKSLKNPVETF